MRATETSWGAETDRGGRLRVTFVLECADLAGGVRVVAEHARRLMLKGHDVTVVSTPGPELPVRLKVSHWCRHGVWPRAPRITASHLDGAGVAWHVLPRYRPVKAGDVLDADVVVATTWRTGHWVHRLPRRKGVHVHLMQHYETWAGWDAEQGCPAAWRLPSHKVVITRWLERICREQFGQEPSLVPNAVDTSLFYAGARAKQAVPTVGLLYHDVRFKAMDVAGEALRGAAELVRAATGESLRVVAFGREVPGAAHPLPPGTHFERLPRQERIRELYQMADVWMCSSRAEGFYLPLLEAMACGTPVVSTEVGSAPEVIDEGVNGHRVPVEDAAALADRIARVVALPEREWAAMSDAARRTARAYTWEDASRLFEAALRRAIALEGGGAVAEPARSLEIEGAVGR